MEYYALFLYIYIIYPADSNAFKSNVYTLVGLSPISDANDVDSYVIDEIISLLSISLSIFNQLYRSLSLSLSTWVYPIACSNPTHTRRYIT